MISKNHIYLNSLLHLLEQIGELKDPTGTASDTKLIDLVATEQLNSIMAYIAVRQWEIHHEFQLDMDVCLTQTPKEMVETAEENGILLDPIEYENHVAELQEDLANYINSMIDDLESAQGDEPEQFLVNLHDMIHIRKRNTSSASVSFPFAKCYHYDMIRNNRPRKGSALFQCYF